MNMLLKRCFLALGLAGMSLMVGCAHQISFAPDGKKIVASGAPRIEKAVAYYVSADDMKREVITPGGGGDKISYFPYREIDAGIYKALSEVFTSVSKLDAPFDPNRPATPALQLVFSPSIVTTSSSSSALTWPATDFTLELTCKVVNGKNAPLKTIVVKGTGKAEFSEFKAEHGLSARRAAEDAMAQLVKALETSPELRQ